MTLAEGTIGERVVYARGAKETLIGAHGVISDLAERRPRGTSLATVCFDKGGKSPCMLSNLDKEEG